MTYYRKLVKFIDSYKAETFSLKALSNHLRNADKTTLRSYLHILFKIGMIEKIKASPTSKKILRYKKTSKWDPDKAVKEMYQYMIRMNEKYMEKFKVS